MLIDTHCHLDFKDFDRDRREVVERAKAAGVGFIINVGSSIEGTRRSLELSGQYECIYTSVGIHPHDARTVTDEVVAGFRQLAGSHKVVAVGEVGLDYYRNLSGKAEQVEAFRKFIVLARARGLPLIIHSRDAHRETLEILKSESERPVRGVMHCFSGDRDILRECVDMGLFISFTCNLTYKNAARLKELAKEVPVERLLLETDAPFLSPEGLRGQRNEPAHIVHLARELARIKGMSIEDIARITTHNASRLFGIRVEDRPSIAYPIRDSLYLNVTNRCTNECDFCVRNFTDFVKGHNLRLAREPRVDEVLEAVRDASGSRRAYSEVVFCGYGEPTLRLDLVKEVAAYLKERKIKVRLVTNGHGDLINSRPIAPELKGLVDRVSVSLNVDSKDAYNRICKPAFGPDSYDAVIAFARECARSGIETEITCLGVPGTDLARCRAIAEDLGARFRARELGVVG